ncbi:MAG: hypothetical protein ACRD11_09895 [Terriglobia bacterium]
MSAGPFSSYVVRRRRMVSVLKIARPGVENKWVVVLFVGALLAVPSRVGSLLAAPATPNFRALRVAGSDMTDSSD